MQEIYKKSMKEFGKIFLYLLFYLGTAHANNASYISLSGQIANKSQIDILSNNLANKSTKGFVADVPTLNFKKIKKSSKEIYLSTLYNVSLDKTPGALKNTGRDLDIAIRGSGFFKVLANGQERYTLNGAISISKDGLLVNQDGFAFLDRDSKEISAPDEPGEVIITENGEMILQKDTGNESIGQIGIFEIPNLNDGQKDAFGYIKSLDSQYKEDGCVLQGYLVESNVDALKTMNELLNIKHSLECNMQFLSASFSMDKSAVETLKIPR